MFRKHGRRPTNIVFVTFRLFISLIMFALLFGGVYSAYKHFSGLDPLKLDPKSAIVHLLEGKIPDEALSLIVSVKVPNQLEKVLGKSQSSQTQKDLPNLTISKPSKPSSAKSVLKLYRGWHYS